ncbi:hypothetical protein CZ797_04855 [Pseudoalteromonas sp. JB197]|nr:hypothetical protein CZ797_04855 [Pseudoalteromonas sp. JB197]
MAELLSVKTLAVMSGITPIFLQKLQGMKQSFHYYNALR